MTPERWQRVRDVLEQAQELPHESRSRFLDVACSSDPLLRNEVQSLLSAADNAPTGFLESLTPRSAPLTQGTRLGDHEIVSQLGAGGMGVVYRARDLRLGRYVAIKVLREYLPSEANRLRRFEQEAQSAAALSHPNILAVYQFGVHKDAPYLVSELLEGETLREELRRGPLAQSRVVELGEQIAEGLSAAHQRGIIHRDLKPENLFVSKDGRVKILDFGLAKLLEEEKDTDEAQRASGFQTRLGTIAGTVGYTSPEQVRGERVDARSDLFSLGVVLYEMATGRRPFVGEAAQDVFEEVINRQPPPVGQLHAGVTPEFERILSKALEKDRDVRYQDAKEIRAELKRLRLDSEGLRGTADMEAVDSRKLSGTIARRAIAGRKGKAVAALVLLLGGVGIWFGYSPARTAISAALARPPKSLDFQIDPPPLNSFRLTGDAAGPPVISPDGANVAFAATGKDGKFKLWVRAVNSVDARALPDTDGTTFPFWSPDSESLGFFADGKLKTINVKTGSPLVLCEAPDGRGGTWGASGEILFAPMPTSPLLRIKARGGSPQPVTQLDRAKYTTHRWPFFLPDQEHFVYFAANHETSKFQDDMVYYASLDGRENRPLFHSETNAVFTEGYLVYAMGDNLMARAFDFSKGDVAGAPISLATRAINDLVTWHVDVSASDAGMLVYGGVGAGSRQLVWLDQSTYEQAGIAVDGLAKLFGVRLSPQGDRIVLQADHEGYEVSVYDLRSKTTVSSFPKQAGNGFPVWSPDGRWIAYASARGGRFQIHRRLADGQGEEQEVLTDDTRMVPRDWNGDNILYYRGKLGNQFECWIVSLRSGQRRRVLENVDECRISPDGRWLAYAAYESLPNGSSVGPLKVFVTSSANGQIRYQVSENSGLGPQWSADGKEIYYLEQSTLSLVRTEVKFAGGAPRFHVLDRSRPNILAEPIFAVSPDKRRILIERIPEPTVVVVTNFAEGLVGKGREGGD